MTMPHSVTACTRTWCSFERTHDNTMKSFSRPCESRLRQTQRSRQAARRAPGTRPPTPPQCHGRAPAASTHGAACTGRRSCEAFVRACSRRGAQGSTNSRALALIRRNNADLGGQDTRAQKRRHDLFDIDGLTSVQERRALHTRKQLIPRTSDHTPASTRAHRRRNFLSSRTNVEKHGHVRHRPLDVHIGHRPLSQGHACALS